MSLKQPQFKGTINIEPETIKAESIEGTSEEELSNEKIQTNQCAEETGCLDMEVYEDDSGIEAQNQMVIKQEFVDTATTETISMPFFHTESTTEYLTNIDPNSSACATSYEENIDIEPLQSETSNQVKPLFCEKCNKTFKRRNHLTIHMMNHTGDRPFPCGICPKKFKTATSLKTHQMSHSDERLFSCEICHKKFKSKDHLNSHEISHSSDRPYSCEICLESFKWNQQLKSHEKTHSNDRPYSCEICRKTFKWGYQLKTHEKTHSDERPFSCEICLKRFKRSSHLQSHAKCHSQGNDPILADCDSKSAAISTEVLNANLESHSD